MKIFFLILACLNFSSVWACNADTQVCPKGSVNAKTQTITIDQTNPPAPLNLDPTIQGAHVECPDITMTVNGQTITVSQVLVQVQQTQADTTIPILTQQNASYSCQGVAAGPGAGKTFVWCGQARNAVSAAVRYQYACQPVFTSW